MRDIWQHLAATTWVRDATGIYQIEARDAAKYPTLYRTKKYLVQNVNSVMVEIANIKYIVVLDCYPSLLGANFTSPQFICLLYPKFVSIITFISPYYV